MAATCWSPMTGSSGRNACSNCIAARACPERSRRAALEKRFKVAKQDLRIRPLYVHSDARIQALLLVNMLALLAYSLLERQAQQAGLHITTRRIIEQLEGLTVIETHCHDGSVLRRLTPCTPEQTALLVLLAELLMQSQLTDLLPTLPAPPEPAARLL